MVPRGSVRGRCFILKQAQLMEDLCGRVKGLGKKKKKKRAGFSSRGETVMTGEQVQKKSLDAVSLELHYWRFKLCECHRNFSLK